MKLSNFLYLSHRWSITPFIPAAVLDEAEAHWFRTVQLQASKLTSAKREFERLARPINHEVAVRHTELAKMKKRYGKFREKVMRNLQITIAPYPRCAPQFFFQLATNYIMPFAKDGEGKGFQDSVILRSVLDHLQSHDKLKGILITRDEGMTQADACQFLPNFDKSKLRFTTLQEAFAWSNTMLIRQ